MDFSDTYRVADTNDVLNNEDISDYVEDNTDQDLEYIPDFYDVCTNEGDEIIEPEDRSSSAPQHVVNKVSTKKKKEQKRDVVWKHRGLCLNDLQLTAHGNTDLPPEVLFPIFFLVTLLLKKVTHVLQN